MILTPPSPPPPSLRSTRRIAFCLDVHNEAIKAMRYPPDAYKKETSKVKDAKEEEVTDDDIRAMQEEDE